MFQDWSQDLDALALQEELDDAVDVELEELVNLEENIESGEQDVLQQVTQYARTCLKEAMKHEPYGPITPYSSPGLHPQQSPVAIPPISAIGGELNLNLERGEDGGKFGSGRSLGSPPSEDSKSTKKRGFTRHRSTAELSKRHLTLTGKLPGLTRLQMILIRDAIVTTIALLMPFLSRVRDISQGSSILTPIFVLILALRPLNNTCIGVEVQQVLSFVFTWPLFYAWSCFMIAVGTSNLGVFMFLFGLATMFGMLALLSNNFTTLCVVLESITFTLIQINIWRTYNFKGLTDEDTKFRTSIDILDGATFSISLPYFLHFVGAVMIFPWQATKPARNSLNNRYCSYAKLLRRLRPVYDRIAVYTLDPTAQETPFSIPADLLDKLAEARAQEVASIQVAQNWLGNALLETRFGLGGRGMAYVSRYEQSLSITRCARSAATDLLTKLERSYTRARSNLDEAEEELEQEKALFLEREATEEFQLEKAELDRKVRERRRIPLLITQINLLLEIGAHRLAILSSSEPGDKSEVETRANAFTMLAREQVFLDKLGGELYELGLSWMGRYLRMHASRGHDTHRPNQRMIFKRTKLAAYILVLLKLTKLNKNAWTALSTEDHSKSRSWLREWILTVPFPRRFLSSIDVVRRESFYTPILGCIPRSEDMLVNFLSSTLWKVSFKFALGTTLLALPGVLESSYQWYSSVQLTNAVFTFQVILFKTQTGLVIERTLQRLLGLILGFITIGVAWELACIRGCDSDSHKWILYAAEVLSIALYLYVRTAHSQYGYIGFAGFRTIVSLSVVFAETESPTRVLVWTQGSYVVASSLVGAAVALVLALFIWPSSGRSMIRDSLCEAYQDFIVLFEQILTERYDHPEDMGRELPKITSFEDRIARNLYGDMTPMLRSAQLETWQHINFDAPHELYLKAVISTRRIWHSLWKLHHLGGIYVYLRDKDGNAAVTMQPTTARDIFAVNRWLTSAFAVVAARFGTKRRDAMPVLRPVAATPHVLQEILQDFLSRAYNDDVFLDRILASRDLSLMCNLPLLNDSLVDISYALDDLFTFMERFLRKPLYADRLRTSERLSFDIYSKKLE
mmetsp:Transcript_12702/g.24643  ORF Transcript_12702/g.24643 Transcript_12702/m.24643 type:complete len:1085 (-) Transcript_12702:66-3320(-)